MALISALAGGLVSTCERLASRYSDGSGGVAGLGISADRLDLLCQRHNPGFSAGGWRSESCLPNLRADLFPKPRDASVSSHNWLQKEKSLGLCQVGTTEMSLSHTSFGTFLSQFGLFKCSFTATAAATKAAGTRPSHWHDRTPVNIPRCSCLP